jgi:hypothetical protein
MASSDSKENLPSLEVPYIDGAGLLRLARANTDEARGLLRQLTPDQIAQAVLDLQPAQRAEFLEVAERVEEIVPLLPEIEFTNTLRTTGLEDAGWMVEFASSEQRVAAVDLDCWRSLRFSPSRFFEWLDAMIEAGPDTLAAAFYELDIEVWVLALREMAEFSIVEFGEEGGSDDMPQDRVVDYQATSAENEERVSEILWTAFLESPSHYQAFVSGALAWSSEACEKDGAVWHRNRMEDLGFPDPEYAKRAYRPLQVDTTPVVDAGSREPRTDALVIGPQLPQPLAGTLAGQALSELPPDRASELLGYVLAVANTLAVADGLPLADPKSVETSLSKALRGIDRGLAELAKSRHQSHGRVLDTTVPLDLFRIGATLDPELRQGRPLAEHDQETSHDDWNVETEEIDEADQTVSRDGRLRD